MADFVLKKQKDFTFALEENPETAYTIPALRSLSLEDAELMTKINDEKSVAKKGKMIREFICRYAPELKDMDVGGMGWFDIFNAYALSQGERELGESKASQDS